MAKKTLDEVLSSDVPSFEALGFERWRKTGELLPRFAGPYGFTSRHIMVRSGKVAIMGSKTGEDYTFSLPDTLPDTLYDFILRQLNLEAEAAPPDEPGNFSSLAFREKLAQNIAGNLAMRDRALAAELAEGVIK